MTDIVLLGTAHVHTPDYLRVAEEEGARVVAVFDRDPARLRHWCGLVPPDEAVAANTVLDRAYGRG